MTFYTLNELLNLHIEGKLRRPEAVTTQQVSAPSGAGFRDVHVYDGKIPAATEPTIISIPKIERDELLAKLQQILINPYSKNMVYLMQRDGEMFDGANTIKPTDILASILSRKMTPDIFFILEEQLADIFLLGQCAQGRTTRLFQVLSLTTD